MTALRINIGCGSTPTPGWINFDNSWSVRLARMPNLARLLRRINLIDAAQFAFVEDSARAGVKWADGTFRIPLESGSVEAVYSSHMLEHLDRNAARRFLRESFRCLRPGGIIRLAVPDLEKLAVRYSANKDADAFIQSTLLAATGPASFAGRVKLAVTGPRHHLWMYDGRSLQRLLTDEGFSQVRTVAAGKTAIADPGALDLWERAEESIYVEGVRGSDGANAV